MRKNGEDERSNKSSSVVLSHGTIYLVSVVLTFESVDETLWCDHSNETSSAVLRGTQRQFSGKYLFGRPFEN